ncbi:hypothetical protein C8R45DRAFT_933185 [Mycena sanguinolenta]|nr:hypothetical protein C8R45DRAFT_933185 [Mycena sanguinolenta]
MEGRIPPLSSLEMRSEARRLNERCLRKVPTDHNTERPPMVRKCGPKFSQGRETLRGRRVGIEKRGAWHTSGWQRISADSGLSKSLWAPLPVSHFICILERLWTTIIGTATYDHVFNAPPRGQPYQKWCSGNITSGIIDTVS